MYSITFCVQAWRFNHVMKPWTRIHKTYFNTYNTWSYLDSSFHQVTNLFAIEEQSLPQCVLSEEEQCYVTPRKSLATVIVLSSGNPSQCDYGLFTRCLICNNTLDFTKANAIQRNHQSSRLEAQAWHTVMVKALAKRHIHTPTRAYAFAFQALLEPPLILFILLHLHFLCHKNS